MVCSHEGSLVVEGEGTLFHRHTKDTAYAMLNTLEGPGETVIASNQFVIRHVELPPVPVVLSKCQCICYNLQAWEANQFIHSLVVPSCAQVESRVPLLHLLGQPDARDLLGRPGAQCRALQLPADCTAGRCGTLLT